ncbi:type II toxin-antitoxin system VapC family toxin [Longimicrobium sp.]|uniref:type II toxin-antitoxin system VapC family toxin n=1 Tax=Longimicrobium sp. TaxID=2029185 RepID=UPI002B51B8BD|nr:type II toxin-antitoxin system VapC family toxin [Longimicrobium sp.]HSU12996.1 type II toxin-antitoxin system VapC family toxin [Longimicrobium sp.]
MSLFIDACALAKRYLPEGRSSQRMKEIMGRSRRWGGLVVSSFIEIEVVSAIAKAAREFGNPLGRNAALREVPRTVDAFQRAYRSGAFTIVDADDAIVQAGIAELRSHPQHEIGAGDAIHLATAVGLANGAYAPLVFVTSDQGLYAAARAHGLHVLNPNYEGSERLDTLFR